MRAFIAALCAFFVVAPAWAQPSSITLNADPVPIVDAQINGRPVRLEVDLRFDDFLVLNPSTAQRLDVQRVPFLAVAVGVDGGSDRLRGRAARPRLVFPGGGDSRAFTGIFAVPASSRADGVIGPGALPYDVITFVLGPPPANGRDVVFRVEDADRWAGQTELAGAAMRVNFNFGNEASVFNRAAANTLDPLGQIHAEGALQETPVALGLRTMMQPVRTDLAVQGLPLAPAYARTNAPLMGALDEDTIVVTGRDDDAPRPSVTLGRTTLSHCSTMTMNRRAKAITLRCAA